MDSYALPNCRPLVGPGNTNHALDGPRRRPRSLNWFVIDMKEHLDTTSLGWQFNCHPNGDTNKKPQSRLWPRGSFFLHVDAKCEPYGRRFGSARNNKARRLFRNVIILLLYLATRIGSSVELQIAGGLQSQDGRTYVERNSFRLP